jgi:hypothetical protein
MIDNDVHLWSEARTKSEIQSLLPDDWEFFFGVHPDGYWIASFVDASKVKVWEDGFPAPNVLLLNAYGWLVMHRISSSPAAVWAPRKHRTLAEVNADALRRARAEDPPDLDPVEVSAVYQGKHAK